MKLYLFYKHALSRKKSDSITAVSPVSTQPVIDPTNLQPDDRKPPTLPFRRSSSNHQILPPNQNNSNNFSSRGQSPSKYSQNSSIVSNTNTNLIQQQATPQPNLSLLPQNLNFSASQQQQNMMINLQNAMQLSTANLQNAFNVAVTQQQQQQQQQNTSTANLLNQVQNVTNLQTLQNVQNVQNVQNINVNNTVNNLQNVANTVSNFTNLTQKSNSNSNLAQNNFNLSNNLANQILNNSQTSNNDNNNNNNNGNNNNTSNNNSIITSKSHQNLQIFGKNDLNNSNNRTNNTLGNQAKNFFTSKREIHRQQNVSQNAGAISQQQPNTSRSSSTSNFKTLSGNQRTDASPVRGFQAKTFTSENTLTQNKPRERSSSKGIVANFVCGCTKYSHGTTKAYQKSLQCPKSPYKRPHKIPAPDICYNFPHFELQET